MFESPPRKKTAVIIGAGPAGLTAAYELLTRCDVLPIVLEQGTQVGGISRTIDYKGNKIDIGGHRFFSKSERVTEWWQRFIPLQGKSEAAEGLPVDPGGPNPEQVDRVMLVRRRLSRIYFLGQFFAYPLELSFQLLRHLGISRTVRMGADYLLARINPTKPERSLADFLRNRFGNTLYQTFFREYTQKLWGVPCEQIKPEWGAQRIKGLSLRKAVYHALFPKPVSKGQAGVETSLIGHFHYPKFGPGQMWGVVTDEILRLGGTVLLETKVQDVFYENSRATCVKATDAMGQELTFDQPEWVISSMPIKELFERADASIPLEIAEVAKGLLYRDFVTVGILCNSPPPGSLLDGLKDNWLYIQEPKIKLGRVQIFNNWSPYLVADPSKIWLGMEYFATEGDEFWSMTDEQITRLAKTELTRIGIAHEEDVVDSVVIRQLKAYPAYFGTYDRMQTIRDHVDSVENLFLVGRNGTHRYNNQDHSMLSAMTAVDIILDPSRNKTEVWTINTGESYHETK